MVCNLPNDIATFKSTYEPGRLIADGLALAVILFPSNLASGGTVHCNPEIQGILQVQDLYCSNAEFMSKTAYTFLLKVIKTSNWHFSGNILV